MRSSRLLDRHVSVVAAMLLGVTESRYEPGEQCRTPTQGQMGVGPPGRFGWREWLQGLVTRYVNRTCPTSPVGSSGSGSHGHHHRTPVPPWTGADPASSSGLTARPESAQA